MTCTKWGGRLHHHHFHKAAFWEYNLCSRVAEKNMIPMSWPIDAPEHASARHQNACRLQLLTIDIIHERQTFIALKALLISLRRSETLPRQIKYLQFRYSHAQALKTPVEIPDDRGIS